MVLLAFREMTVKSMKPEEAAYDLPLCSLNVRFLEPDCAKLTARRTGAMVGRPELVPAEMNVITCQGNPNKATGRAQMTCGVRLLPSGNESHKQTRATTLYLNSTGQKALRITLIRFRN